MTDKEAMKKALGYLRVVPIANNLGARIKARQAMELLQSQLDQEEPEATELLGVLENLVNATDNDMLRRGDFPGVPSAVARAKIAIAKVKKGK